MLDEIDCLLDAFLDAWMTRAVPDVPSQDFQLLDLGFERFLFGILEARLVELEDFLI